MHIRNIKNSQVLRNLQTYTCLTVRHHSTHPPRLRGRNRASLRSLNVPNTPAHSLPRPLAFLPLPHPPTPSDVKTLALMPAQQKGGGVRGALPRPAGLGARGEAAGSLGGGGEDGGGARGSGEEARGRGIALVSAGVAQIAKMAPTGRIGPNKGGVRAAPSRPPGLGARGAAAGRPWARGEGGGGARGRLGGGYGEGNRAGVALIAT